MVAKVSYFIVMLALLTAISSCLKVESFPDEPAIEFLELKTVGDSIAIHFSFTDGDGNFGLDDGDLLVPPFNTGIYNKNLIVDYFELQNGVWKKFSTTVPSTNPLYISTAFNAQVNWIVPEGTNKTQQGEITYHLANPYYVPTSPFDTCRYSLYIIDRDLNESNTELTTTFIKP